MPVYPFQSEDAPGSSEQVMLALPMHEAPRVGEVIERDGRRLRRLPSSASPGGSDFVPYVTHCEPRWTPGYHHTPDGKCVVTSREQERAYERKYGFAGACVPAESP